MARQMILGSWNHSGLKSDLTTIAPERNKARAPEHLECCIRCQERGQGEQAANQTLLQRTPPSLTAHAR